MNTLTLTDEERSMIVHDLRRKAADARDAAALAGPEHAGTPIGNVAAELTKQAEFREKLAEKIEAQS